MIRNILLLFLIGIISLGCGFNPMYSKTSNINFEIMSVEFTGNSQMNSFIENRLNKYSKTSRALESILESHEEMNHTALPNT